MLSGGQMQGVKSVLYVQATIKIIEMNLEKVLLKQLPILLRFHIRSSLRIIPLLFLSLFFSLDAFSQFTKLFDFGSAANGTTPYSAPISDGTYLYGTTSEGGAYQHGTVYKIKLDGTGFTTLFDFDQSSSGGYPIGSLLVSGGFLYGTAQQGGANGQGTIFKIKTDGTGFTVLLNFAYTATGAFPYSSLISDGTFLYGMASQGGTGSYGTAFKIKTDGTGFAKIFEFDGASAGGYPYGSFYSDGTFLYGTTSGGFSFPGTIFKIKPDGTGYVKIFDFNNSTTGTHPYSALISDNTFLYGTTFSGGSNGLGTIFKIKPDGSSYAEIVQFNNSTIGANPKGALSYDGTFLYSTSTDYGANGRGTTFKIKTDGTGFLKILDNEVGTNSSTSEGTMLLIGSTLYGIKSGGGAGSAPFYPGTIFKLNTDGSSYTKLFYFNKSGSTPYGSLVSDGTFFYGMTHEGGVFNYGTIFKVNPDGTGYTTLLDFDGVNSGSNPWGSLFSDGTFLYGMTYTGGANDSGTIFKIKADGTGYTKLFDWDAANNGGYPQGNLSSDGTFLYGTTPSGGSSDAGIVFKIKKDGTGFSIIFNFDGGNDGGYPNGSLNTTDGITLYGSTTSGGTNSGGTIFKINSDGTAYTKLLDLDDATYGTNLSDAMYSDGTFLYGSMRSGGTAGYGTILKLKTDGTTPTTLLNFDNITNGRRPDGPLFSDGTFLYGMTTYGNAGSEGTIFRIKPDGTSFAQLYDFSNGYPQGALISDGTLLYGMTPSGGSHDEGALFKLTKIPFTSISNFDPPYGVVGTYVTIHGLNFDSTPTNNLVKFNGVTAIVKTSSPTSLTAIVPNGATTGPISVTANGTATSSTDFTLTMSTTLFDGIVQNCNVDFTAPGVDDDLVQTFLPVNAGDKIKISFTSFSSPDDRLNIYDGPSTSSPLIASYGDYNLLSEIIPDIIATGPGGELTFEFFWGDGSSSNWDAKISCVTPCATPRTSGDLDISFDPMISNDADFLAVEIQSTGKSIVSAYIDDAYVPFIGLQRYNTDGTLDATFTSLNYYPTSQQLIVQPDDKILAVGEAAYSTYLDRLDEDGNIDPSFTQHFIDNSGFYQTWFGAIALQPDGKVLYSYTNDFNYQFYLNRVNNDGTADASFPTFSPPLGLEITVVKAQSDGSIYVATSSSPSLYKLNSLGNIDPSFDPGMGADDTIYDMAIQPDGKIIIVGHFSTFNGTPRKGIARLLPDGSLDTSFNSGSGVNTAGSEYINSVQLLTDGKIVIAGSFSSYGSPRKNLAKLNSDGSVDCSFDPQGSTDSNISEIAAQQDGKVLVVGDFTNYEGVSRNGYARVNNTLSLIDIAPQPSDANVCIGSTATFTTAASGTTNIAYQWQYSADGIAPYADIVDGVNYSNTATAILSANTTGNFGAGYYRCKISGDFATPVFTTSATLLITIITPPTTTGATSCSPSALILTAAGTADGNYKWYSVSSGGTAISGEVNTTYTTPSLSVSTNYYVSIVNAVCESTRIAVIATINTPPAAPTTIGATSCAPSALVLTAAGTTNGNYKWYSVSSGGAAISGEVNATYTTPSLSASTNYYVSIVNAVCESTRTAVIATINTPPAAPTTIGATSCAPSALVLTAAGTTNGNYKWYSVSSGGAAISGEVNATYTTPSLSASTNYYVSIVNAVCESSRTVAIATINTPPAAPTTIGATGCVSTAITLSASGGATGQYRWYTVASGGTPISAQTNSTFTTPLLTSTTIYFVSINNGLCESSRVGVTATVQVCASNQPPTIAATIVEAPVEGKVTVDLTGLLSDPDNNLDLSTLKIIIQPSSGAKASIDAQRNLILDYAGISFSGREKLTLEVCDLLGACSQKEIEIDVVGDIIVYNGVSPNGDMNNDFFNIEYIDVIEATKKNHVFIYNRWGDVIFDVADYDNKTRVFKGLNNNANEIPSGSYFYKIVFASGKETMTGYLTLKK
jgi:uncharacterized delta-60 repeat protein/gliding motility-associated-like protein